jgi:predicted DNA-binding ribbon-helix-helix protein
MLSLDNCRRILNFPQLSDDEVREIRDTLYSFVRVFIDDYLKQKTAETGKSPIGLEPPAAASGSQSPKTVTLSAS